VCDRDPLVVSDDPSGADLFLLAIDLQEDRLSKIKKLLPMSRVLFSMNTKSLFLVLLFTASAALSGAVDVDIRIGPPPPRREVIGVAPRSGVVWVNGNYEWDGARYVWAPGRWARPPRRHAVWVGPRWVQRRHRWVKTPGRWR
jgi:WXXGXW repeat (2 copies)